MLRTNRSASCHHPAAQVHFVSSEKHMPVPQDLNLPYASWLSEGCCPARTTAGQGNDPFCTCVAIFLGYAELSRSPHGPWHCRGSRVLFPTLNTPDGRGSELSLTITSSELSLSITSDMSCMERAGWQRVTSPWQHR